MSDDKTYIYQFTDHARDTLVVEAYRSQRFARPGPVVVFHTSGAPWLTPQESKKLRKALKAWEHSVA